MLKATFLAMNYFSRIMTKSSPFIKVLTNFRFEQTKQPAIIIKMEEIFFKKIEMTTNEILIVENEPI